MSLEHLQAIADVNERAQAAIAAADTELRAAVAAARAAGHSYADVGAYLGVSRQAAWERFSKDEEAVA